MRCTPAAVLLPLLIALAVPSVAAADARIDFRSNDYVPATVRVVPGARVTWAPAGGESFERHPLASDPGQRDPFGQQRGSEPYSRTFATAGRYRFFCTIHGGPDGVGMAGTVVVSSNSPPVAAFAVDATRAAEGTFAFDATGPGGSSDPDTGQTLSYAWDFGDGRSATTPAPTASYPPAGAAARTYTVRLTVTDSNADGTGEARATATRTVTVPAAPASSPGPQPVAPPDQGSAPEVVLTLGRLPALPRLIERGLPVGVAARSGGRATATLQVAGRRVASAPPTTLQPRTRRTLRLRFTTASRPGLPRGRGRVGGRLTVTVTAPSGVRTTRTRTLRLR